MPVKTNFSIGVLALLLLLIGMEPALTGGAVHECLNLFFAGAILVHLLLHWDWIVHTFRCRFVLPLRNQFAVSHSARRRTQ